MPPGRVSGRERANGRAVTRLFCSGASFEPIGNRRKEFGKAEGRMATERVSASESMPPSDSVGRAYSRAV